MRAELRAPVVTPAATMAVGRVSGFSVLQFLPVKWIDYYYWYFDIFSSNLFPIYSFVFDIIEILLCVNIQ